MTTPQPTPQPLPALWTYALPSGAVSKPVVVAGDRLIAVNEGQCFGVEIYPGATPNEPGGLAFESPQFAPSLQLAVADGALFVWDGSHIQAFQLADGSTPPSWTNATPPHPVKALVGFPGVVVAIMRALSGPSQIVGYDTSDGSQVWPRPTGTAATITLTGDSIQSIGAADDAFFYVDQNQLVAVNSAFGDTRFQQSAPSGGELTTGQAPLVGLGVVVCAGDNVYGFDRKTGTITWTVSAPGAVTWACAMSPDQQWVVAVNSAGQAFVIDPEVDPSRDANLNTDNGAVVGQPVQMSASLGPGTPTLQLTEGALYVVVPPAKDQPPSVMDVFSFDSSSGTLVETGLYTLGQNLSTVAPPVVTNGTMFVTAANGEISAFPDPNLATWAAYFDGQASIVMPLTGQAYQFAFGTGDFGIEAWIRGTVAGEILSSTPAGTGDDAYGFRFNVGPHGELRYAAASADLSNRDLAWTGPTVANDGYWHHVAVTRRGGAITFYLDGVAVPPVDARSTRPVNGVANTVVYRNGDSIVPITATKQDGTTVTVWAPDKSALTPAVPPPPCNIGSQQSLTIGAYAASGVVPASFTGLMRELRVWDTGLDGSVMKSRMVQMLGPLDPTPSGPGAPANCNASNLRGNWHLDEIDADGQVLNDVDHADQGPAKTERALRAVLAPARVDPGHDRRARGHVTSDPPLPGPDPTRDHRHAARSGPDRGVPGGTQAGPERAVPLAVRLRDQRPVRRELHGRRHPRRVPDDRRRHVVDGHPRP